jgi:hypothetical protein
VATAPWHDAVDLRGCLAFFDDPHRAAYEDAEAG